MTEDVKYECQVCEQKGFKSRSDWLFHLVLNRHSQKARENMQQLYLLSKGSMYVVTGIEQVDRTLLLDHVASKLPTFTNFICFKPEAEICMIVAEPKEFEKFAATPQCVSGRKLEFKDYNEISPTEWKRYFIQNRIKDIVEANKALLEASISNSPTKRKVEEVAAPTESQRKHPRLDTKPPEEGLLQPNGRNKKAFVRSFLRRRSSDWASELAELYEAIMLSDAERNIRLTVMEELTKLLRPDMTKCELIPVGGDFLGFKVEHEVFTMYFDSQGMTVPDVTEKTRTVNEYFKTIDNTRNRVFRRLKNAALSDKPVLSQVKCNGAHSIEFVYLVYGLIKIKCNILLKSFQMAETALLCKKLFFTNPQVMSLVSLAVYWASKRNEIAGPCLANPYVIYWLVYYFLISKKLLPPIIELQKSTTDCKLMDREMNVGFSYDSSLLHAMVKPSTLDGTQVESDLMLFSEWLSFMDDTVRLSLRSGVICPRYGGVIHKIWIQTFKQYDSANGTLSGERASNQQETLLVRVGAAAVGGGSSGNQKRSVRRANSKLVQLGFDGSSLDIVKKFELTPGTDTLNIQHPFYISENVSLNFDELVTLTFIESVKTTRESLGQLLSRPFGRKGSFVKALL